MRMSELDTETAVDRYEALIEQLEAELMTTRRALNDIIMLEVAHSGLSTARIIQEACDIARVAIYGETRRQSLEKAAHHENS